MNFEDLLRRDLGARAGTVGAAVDVAALVRAGRREQRLRRTAGGVGAGALTAVVVTGVALSGGLPSQRTSPLPPATQTTQQVEAPTTAPTTAPTIVPGAVAEMPVGAGSLVPWWQDGILHVADARIPTELRQFVSANGVTLVGDVGSATSVWQRVDDGALVDFHVAQGAAAPLLSADGATAVFVESPSPARVVVRAIDVVTGTELGVRTESVDPDAGPAPSLELVGIGAGPRVVYRMGPDAWLWRPGSDVVPVTGVPVANLMPMSQAAAVWPGGLTRLRYPDDIIGSLDDTGAFTRVGTVPSDGLGVWSPSGTTFVFEGDPDAVPDPGSQNAARWAWALQPGGDPRRLLLPELPRQNAWLAKGWEDDTHVVLRYAYRDGRMAIARCDTVTLACELAGDQPTGATTMEGEVY